MKIEEFKNQLSSEVRQICDGKDWDFKNNKRIGMAFENWCFELFQKRYENTDNSEEDFLLRSRDFGIDMVFPVNDEPLEVFFVQAKYEESKGNSIDSGEVEKFFLRYKYFFGKTVYNTDTVNNERIKQIFSDARIWKKDNYKIHFIFISSGESTAASKETTRVFNEDHEEDNVVFDVWDISRIRDEYVEIESIEEPYPEEVNITLGEGSFLKVGGPKDHLTFVVPGTVLSEIYSRYKERLFNWNIRRYLGRRGRGSINSGIAKTIKEESERFYYLNNGISALCDSFEFDEDKRELKIKKLQIVNGAQTIGAIGNSGEEVKNIKVLVKLTAIRHAHKEKDLAASIIKANNTQNSLKIPDFRANDQIQLWLEQKFKDTKAKGKIGKIIYGRKQPYTKPRDGKSLVKMMDFGKIRYAWEVDPRLAIDYPGKLFIHKTEGGSYEYAFGNDGELVDMWSNATFNEALLALHCFYYCEEKLKEYEKESFTLSTEEEETSRGKDNEILYTGLSKLKLYALHCMKIYADDYLMNIEREDLYAFGKKFDTFCKNAIIPIKHATQKTYKEISNEGRSTFIRPRDAKIWKPLKASFIETCKLLNAQLREQQNL